MDANRGIAEDIEIRLTVDEMLLLSDLLHRWEYTRALDTFPFEDQAELRILWNLNAVLEPLVDDAFSPEYKDRIEQARAVVRDPLE